MARYRGPKNKLARREGVDLGLKTVGSAAHTSLLRRLKIKPGQHGQKMTGKLSEFGVQLREKQKMRRIYGILERQFHNYYLRAAQVKGVTGEELLRNLERRLDNVVYRLSFAATRNAARQMVRHGHVKVNDRRVDIPSFQVKAGDIISLRGQILKNQNLQKALVKENQIIPSWLVRKGPAGKVVALPKRQDIVEEVNEQLIVEFYSR